MIRSFSIRIPRFAIRNYSRRIAGHDGPRRNISGNDSPRADDRTLANCNAAQNGGVAANASLGSHDRGNYFPINFGLQPAAFSGCARIFIVDENDAMADENFVLNRDAFTDKAMRGNFAVAADARTFLNLDE